MQAVDIITYGFLYILVYAFVIGIIHVGLHWRISEIIKIYKDRNKKDV
tara:strand:+ start:187 stop:330 length:144 start_codon:yes stop_codon:yes gene_type:complete